MSGKASRADWAATVPWTGITGKPAFLTTADVASQIAAAPAVQQTIVQQVPAQTSGIISLSFLPAGVFTVAAQNIQSQPITITLDESAALDTIGTTRGSMLYRGASGWSAYTKQVYASSVAVLNSNVSTGGGTDDTAALQTVLNQASGGTVSLELVMDGAALVTGLNIYSNTTIRCLNKSCGFFLKSASNRPIVRNANPTTGTVVDKNITLSVGTYNGNAANQGTILAGEGDVFVQGIAFYGIINLTLRDVKIQGAHQYAFACSNWTNVLISSCELQQGLGAGVDGFHFFCGSHLIVKNCWGQTGSDFVALNSSDYHDQGSAPWVIKDGDITDVTIENIVLQASANGVGILAGTNVVDNVTVRNVRGSVRDYAMSLWNAWSTAYQGGHIGTVLLDNLNIVSSQNIGSKEIVSIYSSNLDNALGTPGANNIHNLQIVNCQWADLTDTRPWLRSDQYATIDVLQVDGFVVEESPSGQNSRTWMVTASTINRLSISALDWKRPTSSSGQILANSGTIGLLSMHGIVTNIATVISNTGTITAGGTIETESHQSYGTYLLNPGSLGRSIAMDHPTGCGITFRVNGTSTGQLWCDSSVFNFFSLGSEELRFGSNGSAVVSIYTNNVMRAQWAANGNLTANSVCLFTNSTEATNYTVASVVYSGGLGVAKKIITNSSLQVGTGFGCNGAAPQTAYASGGAAGGTPTLATGYGFVSAAEMNAFTALVANIRLALVADGVMS